METGYSRGLQTHHDKLWEEEVVELQYCILVPTRICYFQATDPDRVRKFYGIIVNRLLDDWELEGVRE